jgi:hypothetical protein
MLGTNRPWLRILPDYALGEYAAGSPLPEWDAALAANRPATVLTGQGGQAVRGAPSAALNRKVSYAR